MRAQPPTPAERRIVHQFWRYLRPALRRLWYGARRARLDDWGEGQDNRARVQAEEWPSGM